MGDMLFANFRAGCRPWHGRFCGRCRTVMFVRGHGIGRSASAILCGDTVCVTHLTGCKKKPFATSESVLFLKFSRGNFNIYSYVVRTQYVLAYIYIYIYVICTHLCSCEAVYHTQSAAQVTANAHSAGMGLIVMCVCVIGRCIQQILSTWHTMITIFFFGW